MHRQSAKICDYCVKKIKSKYIKCTDCYAELCVRCFCYGVEEGSHKKTHNYTIDDVRAKMYWNLKSSANWNLEEEEAFLDGLERYKAGNWSDIASKLEGKSAQDCRQFFLDNYLHNGFTKCLLMHLRARTTRLPTMLDHTTGVQEPDLWTVLPPVLMTPDEERSLGLNSARNEFSIECDDAAERLVSDISPRGVDDVDKELHQSFYNALTEMYNRRLVRRHRTKTTIRQHNLIPHVMADIGSKPARDFSFFHRRMLKYRASSEPQLHRHRHQRQQQQISLQEHSSWSYNAFHLKNELKPLLQFLSAGNMREMFENLKNEQVLKTEISALKYCIQNDVQNYQDLKKRIAADSTPKNTPQKSFAKPNTTLLQTRKKSLAKSFGFINRIRSQRRKDKVTTGS